MKKTTSLNAADGAKRPGRRRHPIFTSGTTSDSKGVVLSNMNLMHSIFTHQQLIDLTATSTAR